jgi:aconitase A
MEQDIFNARDQVTTRSGSYTIYRLDRLEDAGLGRLSRLPFSIRVLLESALRGLDGHKATRQDVVNLAGWQPRGERPSIPFNPGRLILQDFTGVPVVVDLAAMRSALARLGGDPQKINPTVPVDLVIDHSVQVDFYNSPEALMQNAALEFSRNRERYEFLHWAQNAFNAFRRSLPPQALCTVTWNTWRACSHRRKETSCGLPRQRGVNRLAHHHEQRPWRGVGWALRDRGHSVMVGEPSTCSNPK